MSASPAHVCLTVHYAPPHLLELVCPDGSAAVPVEEGEDSSELGQLVRGELLYRL